MTDPRPYTPEDAPAWVALNNLVFDRKNTLENFRATDSRRRPDELMRRWVVEDGAEVVGLAALYTFPFVPPGHLHLQLGVHPGHRARGVGQALWHTLEGAAREARAAGLVVDVGDTDTPSRAWAERYRPQTACAYC